MQIPDKHCIIVDIANTNDSTITIKTSQGLVNLPIEIHMRGMSAIAIVKNYGYRIIEIIPIISKFVQVDGKNVLLYANISKYQYILITNNTNANITEVWHYYGTAHFSCIDPDCRFLTHEQYTHFIDGFQMALNKKVTYSIA